VRLGPVTLVARELRDDRVVKVGLKLAHGGGTLVGRTRIRERIARLFGRRQPEIPDAGRNAEPAPPQDPPGGTS
jgi:hypothetical protein